MQHCMCTFLYVYFKINLYVLVFCMYVYMCTTWCLWGSGEGIGFPGTGDTNGCEHHMGVGN